MIQMLGPCAPIFFIGFPMKTQVENRMDKIFKIRGQNIDVPCQDFSVLTDMVLVMKKERNPIKGTHSHNTRGDKAFFCPL